MTPSSILALLLALAPAVPPAVDEPTLLELGTEVEGELGANATVVTTSILETRFQRAPTVGNAYTFTLPDTGTYFIELRSTQFDSYLVLESADGDVLAEDDDGFCFYHSRLILNALEPGKRYTLRACALHGLRGSYTLRFHNGSELITDPQALAQLGHADAQLYAAHLLSSRAETPLLTNEINTLAHYLKRRGYFADALPLFERSLQLLEKQEGKDASNALRCASHLSQTLLCLGEEKRAREFMAQSLLGYARKEGPKIDEAKNYLERLFENPDKAVETLLAVSESDPVTREQFLRFAGPYLSHDQVRDTLNALASEGGTDADSWQLEFVHTLPPLHDSRILGTKPLGEYLSEDKISKTVDHVLEEFEEEQKEHNKAVKRWERQQKGKMPSSSRFYFARLQTALACQRAKPMSTSLERQLWKKMGDLQVPSELKQEVILAFSRSTRKKTFKRIATACLATGKSMQISDRFLPYYLRTLSESVHPSTASEDSRKAALKPLRSLFAKIRPETLDPDSYYELCKLAQAEGEELGREFLLGEANGGYQQWHRLTAMRYLCELRSPPDLSGALESYRRSAHSAGDILRLCTHLELAAQVDPDKVLELASEYLNANDARLRLRVAGLLGSRSSAPEIEILAKLISDESPQVASVALWSLYNTRKFSAIDEILAKLESLAEKGGLPLQDALEILQLSTQEDPKGVQEWIAWRKQRETLPASYELDCGRSTRVGSFFDHRIYSHHVGFVVDLSGSMIMRDALQNQTRVEWVYRELAQALRSLDECTQFSLVLFSTGAASFRPHAVRATTANIDAALEFMRTRQPGGSTSYHSALERVFAAFDLDTIYFLSDGAPSLVEHKTADRLLQWVGDNNSGKLTLNTIGFNDEDPVLEALAERNGGTYHRIHRQ